MPAGRPAAGGGRWLQVAPERIERWLAGFAERHGGVTGTAAAPGLVTFRAADGAIAECHVPFPPLAPGPGDPDGAARALAAHASRARRVGVLLARLGGHAAGVFDGTELIASKVGARPVHGRSAAGGQSQARFARRRDKQAREALEAAAATAVRVLTPYLSTPRRLEAVVLGGDRHAIGKLREEPRLAPLFARAVAEPFLAVPDPRLAVLERTPATFRAVRIRLSEP